jgi:hypothetical protein
VVQEKGARAGVAAVSCNIDECPHTARAFELLTCCSKEDCGHSEESFPAHPYRFARFAPPRKWIEEPEPARFKTGKIMSTDASGQQLVLDLLKARLGRSACASVELFETLAPPGQPNRAEHRLARRAYDVPH